MGLVKRPPRKGAVSIQLQERENSGEASSNSSLFVPSWKRWRVQSRTLLTKRTLTLFTGVFLLFRCQEGWLRLINGRYDYLLTPSFDRFYPVPVIVQSPTVHNVTKLELEDEPPRLISNRRNRYWRQGEVYNHRLAETVPEGCVAEAEWWNDTHPSCNFFHQIDLGDFFFNRERARIIIDGHKRRNKVRHIGRGGFRSAFMFHEHDGTRRVLKTLLYREDRDFEPRMVDRMRKDAVVSEQLSSSKYIVDVYGYCAQSSLVDYSNYDDMLSLFRHKEKPTKDDLFKVAHDVSQSMADAHHFNEEGRATIAHMDIKPNQWIYLDGMYKLNDFNLAKFLTWDHVKKKNCKYASGYSGGRWQAPEQFHEGAPRSEKADTFSLGYILNFLLTGKKPFPDLDGEEVQELVEKGTMWRVSDPNILNSTHPFDIAVRKASEMCLVFEPEKRPHAQEVADVIRVALAEYKKSKQSTVDQGVGVR